MTTRALIRTAATFGAIALAAVVVAGAGAATGQRAAGTLLDGRAPDTIDAAVLVSPTADRDLRSPDTRDALSAGATLVRPTADRDLRSPDTRDALGAPAIAVTSVDAGGRSGFDWADAGIGALITAVLIGLAGGFLLVLLRPQRRHRVQAS